MFDIERATAQLNGAISTANIIAAIRILFANQISAGHIAYAKFATATGRRPKVKVIDGPTIFAR